MDVTESKKIDMPKIEKKRQIKFTWLLPMKQKNVEHAEATVDCLVKWPNLKRIRNNSSC